MAFRRIVGLGLCVVDHLYLLDGEDRAAVRARYRERVERVGGMTATALCQAARLGCPAHVVSLVGDDPEGRRVRRELRAAGVVTRRLVLSRALPTTVAVCLVERDSGERRFLLPDRRRLERSAPDFDLGAIDARTLLLVDGHFPAQALRAARRARELGATVIGDFHRPTPAVRRLLRLVDYPIVADEFARSFAGADPAATVRRLAERYGSTPIVTLGERGGLYWGGGRVRRYRAARARVVDTTGAGDAFHGAFAAGLSRGEGLEESLALGARAAAVCCTALGGSTRLLGADEL